MTASISFSPGVSRDMLRKVLKDLQGEAGSSALAAGRERRGRKKVIVVKEGNNSGGVETFGMREIHSPRASIHVAFRVGAKATCVTPVVCLTIR